MHHSSKSFSATTQLGNIRQGWQALDDFLNDNPWLVPLLDQVRHIAWVLHVLISVPIDCTVTSCYCVCPSSSYSQSNNSAAQALCVFNPGEQSRVACFEFNLGLMVLLLLLHVSSYPGVLVLSDLRIHLPACFSCISKSLGGNTNISSTNPSERDVLYAVYPSSSVGGKYMLLAI